MAEEITSAQFYFSSSFFFFFSKVDENHRPVGKFNVFFFFVFVKVVLCVCGWVCVRLCISSCIINREHHSFTIFGNLTKNCIFCVCASVYLSEREREKNENTASNFLRCRNALFNIPQKQYPRPYNSALQTVFACVCPRACICAPGHFRLRL